MRLLAAELKGTSQVKSFSTECFDEASTSAGAETPLLNAKPCVISFCEAMHKEVLALVTTDSLLLMRATAMQVWEQGLESSTSLWDAWCRMWDNELTFPYCISEGSEVRRTAMLRELQGLFVQRYLHAMACELLSLCGANKKASVDKVTLCLGEEVDLLAPSGVTVGAVLLHAQTDQAAAPSPTPSVVLPLLPSQLPQPNSGVAPLLCRGEVCGGKRSVPRDARGPKGCMHCTKCCNASREAAQGPYSCAAHKGPNKKT
eukprot:gene22249-29319_t